MGNLLKFLSALSGSSEETLLKARAQISNRYGIAVMSNETERNYILKKIASEIPKLFLAGQIERMNTVIPRKENKGENII